MEECYELICGLDQCSGGLLGLTRSLTERITSLGLTESELVARGRDLLLAFVQMNWTGPPLTPLPVPVAVLEHWDKVCCSEILYDGESYRSVCRHPSLVYMSHVILCDLTNNSKSEEAWLWRLRCLYMEQQLLTHHSQTLWGHIQHAIDDELSPLLSSADHSHSDEWLCAVHLELFYYLLYYHQYEHAAHHLHTAESIVGVSSSLTGVIGRRTQYQQVDIAQLVLEVATTGNHDNMDSKEEDLNATEFPKDVLLEDDTLLPHIKVTDPLHQATPTQLTSLQQAVVLAQCVYHQKTSPTHVLTNETLEAYLEYVLAHPQCWSVQSAALFHRSVVQRNKRRTVERSMMQLQELVDCYSKATPDAAHRLQLLHCVCLPPSWVVERELASTLVSIGDVHSAVEVYQRLQMWEELINCYQAVGRRGQAEVVVRQRMKEDGETPILCCLLGDTIQDPQWYERAWELSGHRSARAQRSLGLFYLRKGEYKHSVECLQKSLGINSLQLELWFSLGCAATSLGDLALAGKAFTRCVSLDAENFEAWNNLAGVCVKSNKKEKAFTAYQHAIRGNYENWMIWENYLLVCVDIGEFEEGIGAYHRLMDLKNKYLDTEVLKHLVDAVIGGVASRNGKSASLLRKKLGQLLGRAVSQITTNVELWELSARYHLSDTDPVSQDKGVTELQRAQRTSRQQQGWEKNAKTIEQVVNLTVHYCTVCRQYDGASPHLSSAKLAVQATITRLKQVEGVPCEMMDQLYTEQQLITKLLTTRTQCGQHQ